MAGIYSTKEIIELFGLDISLEEFISNGKQLIMYDNRIELTKLGSSLEIINYVKVTTAAISLVTKGALGPSSLGIIKKDIEDMVGLSIKSTELIEKPKKAKKKVTNTITVEKPSVVMSGKPVHLKDATKLYQPVFGSSNGSIYYCVGISLDNSLKIAARCKDSSNISVRIEGDIKKYESIIEEAGVSVHAGSYASIHVSSENSLVMAGKIVGSILVALGKDYRTQVPSMEYLAGKGA